MTATVENKIESSASFIKHDAETGQSISELSFKSHFRNRSNMGAGEWVGPPKPTGVHV